MAKEIFDAATADDDDDQVEARQPEPELPLEDAKEAPAAPEPKAKAEEPKPEPEAAPPQEPAPDKPTYQVPIAELLSTRERAQNAERERDDLKRALETIQRQQQQAARQPQEVPDVFADPQAYTNHLQQTFQQPLQELRLDFDLQLAEVRHGKAFTEAYDAFIQAVGSPGRPNPQLYHEVMAARSPGEAIVQWHKRESVLREVGSDPAAYRQKLQTELLQDQDFLNQVMEKVRQQAGQPNGSRNPQNVTRLPSLNRQTSAAASRDVDDNDGSKEAIWDAATR
jgi:hypothetical protein